MIYLIIRNCFQYYAKQDSNDYYGDRRVSLSSYHLPDAVMKFITHLYHSINNRDISEIESLYEVRYPLLSKEYFKEERWPLEIQNLVDEALVTY